MTVTRYLWFVIGYWLLFIHLPTRSPVPVMLQIALFGTSADPPTAAHQHILKWLSHHFDEVAVWASDNPFKSHQTPLIHRAAMLKLLIQDIYPPRYNLHYCPELSSPRALITVERAQQQWPNAVLTLVIGSDLIDQLPRWYCVDTLLRQVKLLIVPRPGYPVVEGALRRLQEMGAAVAIADLTGLPISSTAYREQGDGDILTPPVEEYIHRKQLYACQDAAPKSLLTHHSNGWPTSK